MSDLPPLPPLPATFGVLASNPQFREAVEAYALTVQAAERAKAWNEAIEAAAKYCEQATGLTPFGIVCAIRALKVKP